MFWPQHTQGTDTEEGVGGKKEDAAAKTERKWGRKNTPINSLIVGLRDI
jgi:hypothetical protein